MYTVNQVFQTALRAFSGTSRNSFASPNGIITDAVRAVTTNVDLIESERVVPLTPALYIGDNLYQIPDDVSTILSLEPNGGRGMYDQDMNRTSGLSMNRNVMNRGQEFATEFRNGVKLLRVQPGRIIDTPIILNICDSITGNGTVTVAGDANSLDTNQVFFLNGSASLDFNITASTGTATLSITDMVPVDISTITRDGAFTVGVFIPLELVGHVTNMKFRIGNDGANYYEMTTNKNAYGGDLIHGFNILRFEKRHATTAGAVDETDTKYLSVDVVHDLATATVVTGVKVDAIAAHKGLGYDLSYYSKYHFIHADTGAFIETPNSTGLTDKVIVESDAFSMVVYEAQKIMDMTLRGEKAGLVYQRAERELNGIWGDFSRPGMYEQYRLRHPSKRRSVVTQYESQPYE